MSKKALIAPNENYRILEVKNNGEEFEVAPPWIWVTCPNATTRDWTYDHTTDKFDPPVSSVYEVTVVTMRQARLALLEQGILAAVEGILDSLSEPTKSAARIEWEYATEVQKSSPLVAVMAAAIPLNPTQLTALFDLAATK